MITQTDLFDPQRLKDEGIQQVTEHNATWVARAIAEISRLARIHSTVSADDLRLFIHREGPPKHPNAIGAAFSGAAKSGVIRRDGIVKSTVPSNHARWITVWRAVG